MLNIFILLWNIYFYWRMESSRQETQREKDQLKPCYCKWNKKMLVDSDSTMNITSLLLNWKLNLSLATLISSCSARTGNKGEPYAAWGIWFSFLREKIITLSKRRQKGLLVGPYEPLRYFLTVSYLLVKVTGEL